MPGSTNKKVDSITVRMYRGGTGDFFALLFKSGKTVTFKMVIDCGCIQGSKETFEPLVKDLTTLMGNSVDLLVVTHEHADHINGFKLAKNHFDNITFKEVWFAWTENTEDDIANDYRQNHAKTKFALANAIKRMNGLVKDGYFERLYKNAAHQNIMLEGTDLFLNGLNQMLDLNKGMSNGLGLDANGLKTMEDYLRENKVIKATTEVDFLNPGDIRENLTGAEGIRFFVLGPPKSRASLNLEERHGDNFDQRQKPSTVDFALADALALDDEAILPFEQEHNWTAEDDIKGSLKECYGKPANDWRKIDHDWLFSAGSMSLRYERSINNTSLVLAIQFADSERVLLFPGDAELGNWLSWQDATNTWSIKQGEETKTVNADYLLQRTVFYKVGHHLSQNGTAKGQGVEKMKSSDLTAVATLDFKKIGSNWKNTMPNDLLGAELIRKTKGKFYFVGDREKILQNIRTGRTAINKTHVRTLERLNKPFDDKKFIDVVIPAEG